jgi:MSHA biogenesis protein MshP
MPFPIRRFVSAGFSLVSAIFLIVVLAGLGVAMMFVSTMQHQSTALDVQGVRAYQAARAGIEWGLYQRIRVLNNSACFTPNPRNLSFPAGSSLLPFTVTVTCAQDSIVSGINTARITAVACNMPTGGACSQNQTNNSPDFVLRVVEVRL